MPEAGTALAPGPGGDWPRTNRVLPWSLAGFLVMLWVIPFDAMDLPVNLPIDAKLDRLVLVVMGGIWLGASLAGGPASPKRRRSGLDAGFAFFFAAAYASVMLNGEGLRERGELELAIKSLALLAAYVFFFYLVSSTVRPAEVPRFINLMLGLACITAVGTIWEFRNEVNLFYTWSDKIFPGVSVTPDQAGVDSIGRLFTNGPTGHAIAVATLLSIAIPLAVVNLMQKPKGRIKWLYRASLVLAFAGAFATARKTGALVPAAALLTLILYRPKGMLKLLPLGLVVVIGVHGLAPGAIGSIRGQLAPDRFASDAPVEGRKQDYSIVRPEIDRRPLMGRGYGSYDAETYRYLDNQYLVLLLESGYVGTIAFLMLVIGIVVLCHPIIRSRDRARAPTALAVSASAVAFGVGAAFYDILAFPHVPYLMFLLAAFAVVLRKPLPAEAPMPALALPQTPALSRT
jgi:O-antigen ligase